MITLLVSVLLGGVAYRMLSRSNTGFVHYAQDKPPDKTTNQLLQTQQKPKIQILIWAGFHGIYMIDPEENPDKLFYGCPNSFCQFTHNASKLLESEAVMFDLAYHRLVVDGKMKLPPVHPAQQYWFLFNYEPLLGTPSFLHVLPGNVFNFSISFNRDSEIYMPYGSCYPRTKVKYSLPDGFPSEKSGLVVWHASRCTDQSRRLKYIQALQNHTTVDIFGLCGEPLPEDHRLRGGTEITMTAKQNINKYKFYLAFENSYCNGYVTEKAFKILQDDIHTVPIVRGSGPYKGVLPTGSYINADDFGSPRELAEYLHELDKDDTRYRSYFKPRYNNQCVDYITNTHSFPCMVCDGVMDAIRKNTKKILSQSDIYNLFHSDIQCTRSDF